MDRTAAKLVTKREVERIVDAKFTSINTISLCITSFLVGYFVSSLVG